ncbi:60S ribosomal protein L18, putative [Babesia bigemina]|uniref:60S ribosomal protein L18, putative n=1 Tax=Babesia bigemina TaxID=5866 RepID=A0A061DD55_BABBI|nr:60S ribosomal protein L18, putative [Babesia bigemina]CDR97119.1 60S ribosomal protein L18, putative [Babesia bigemina]|eukprot:XP_012769305.1 60S ribosomal protein L18, putative [Babesia bigemina]
MCVMSRRGRFQRGEGRHLCNLSGPPSGGSASPGSFLPLRGIDLKKGGRVKKPGRKALVSKDPYLRLLVKTYKTLARRTSSAFNRTVLKRLLMPRRFKAPISLSKLIKHMKGRENTTAVVVGTVTGTLLYRDMMMYVSTESRRSSDSAGEDDLRVNEVPKLSVCALRITRTAQARLLKAGGEVLTFDELVARSPTGSKCTLLRGATKAREAEKHFGKAPGTPGSSTKPYVRSKGRKFEKARGRRKSCGFKV